MHSSLTLLCRRPAGDHRRPSPRLGKTRLDASPRHLEWVKSRRGNARWNRSSRILK